MATITGEGDIALESVPSGRRWSTAALVVAVLVGVLIGSLGYWLTRPPAENSYEVVFARDMVAHHQQAVDMALIMRDRATNAEIRQFALDIALTQQAQIGQMQGWLAAWGRPNNGATPPMGGHGDLMGMASAEDVERLKTLPPTEAETLFLQLMIPHHQGGVAMARSVLPGTQRPEVTRLATAIINGQQSEIDYMKALLAKRGATTS